MNPLIIHCDSVSTKVRCVGEAAMRRSGGAGRRFPATSAWMRNFPFVSTTYTSWRTDHEDTMIENNERDTVCECQHHCHQHHVMIDIVYAHMYHI